MGIGIGFSRSSSPSSCDCDCCKKTVIYETVAPLSILPNSLPPQPPPPPLLPNPNPENWSIEDGAQFGDYLAVKILYPDCTNYEGIKILVYRATFDDIRAQKFLDPHFGEGYHIYPIARFQPTNEGWRDALQYAAMKDIAEKTGKS